MVMPSLLHQLQNSL